MTWLVSRLQEGLSECIEGATVSSVVPDSVPDFAGIAWIGHVSAVRNAGDETGRGHSGAAHQGQAEKDTQS